MQPKYELGASVAWVGFSWFSLQLAGVVSGLDSFERFCGRLVLDNGQPMVLEPFQRTMLTNFFDGTRETVVCIAKGSGKTTLLAALALYELLTDPGCEGAVCAASRDQGAILLTQLRGFVERSPGLGARVRLKQREAVNRMTGGRFRVLAADTDTMDGLLLTFAVADEVHRWRDAERYVILLAGVQKRDGRIFGISTAGVRDEGLLWAMRERALELGAARDGSYLGLRVDHFAWHEWSLAEDANLRDVEAVKAANPATWVTLELLRERFESPSMTEIDWRRFSANQWVDRSEVAAVIAFSTWQTLAEPGCRPSTTLVFAIDAAFDNTTAAIAVGGYDDADLVVVDVVDYGSGTAWLIERLLQLDRAHTNCGVVVDSGSPAGALIPRLEEYGLTVHATGTREFARACVAFKDLVERGELRHSGSDVLGRSVQGALRRRLTDLWAWDRKRSLGDTAPLCAATLAAWGGSNDRPGKSGGI